ATYRIIRREIEVYGAGLTDKPEIVAVNKCDALTLDVINEKTAAVSEAAGSDVLAISGLAGTGVDRLLDNLFQIIAAKRAEDEESEKAYSP
ncbi:MAG: GTPase ObgE, partial [Pseudomonadota bacterium]|nr:GTPase ObgE [Pseudomonadota bacterium]